jgi:integrase
MAAARAIRWRLPAATHETVIGLLASTGIRVGEAIRLDRTDVDQVNGVLHIRESKFGKSRFVPVLTSTLAALGRYVQARDQLLPNPATPSFFVSVRGTRLIYPVVQRAFPASSRRTCVPSYCMPVYEMPITRRVRHGSAGAGRPESRRSPGVW